VGILASFNLFPRLAKILESRIIETLSPMFAPFTAASLMVGCVYLTKSYLFTQKNLTNLLSLVVVGIFTYAICIYILDRKTIKELWVTLRSFIQQQRSSTV